MKEQQSQQSITQDAKQQFGLLLFLSQMHAYPVEALTRKPGTVGCRYFSNTGAYFAIVWPWFWIAFFNGEPNPLLAGLATLYPFVRLVHVRQTRRATAQGGQIHSQDIGDSRFGRYENAVVLTVGLLGMPWSPAFGTYLVVSTVCTALNHDVCKWRDRAIVQSMIDARIEQEHYRRKFDAHG